MKSFPYSTALITGASSGFGEEFVWQLAKQVKNIVITARRQDVLENIASKVRCVFPDARVFSLPHDLSMEEERIFLKKEIEDLGLEVDLLINNAGLGDYGEFSQASWEKSLMMLKVNNEALVHLTYLFLPVIKKHSGGVINMSSLAATLPIPDFALYAATKAFVSSFSEGLAIEVRESGVSVLAVCPGPVSTGFGQVARRSDYKGDLVPGRGLFYTKKSVVVREALSSLLRGNSCLFPGWKIKGASSLIRMMPLGILRIILRLRPRRVK